MQFFLVGLGGFIGAVFRYAVVRLFASQVLVFPFATLFVNVLGSFLLGLFSTWILHKTLIEPELRLAIQVGLLGAFTTFSTFSFETLNLVSNGQMIKAATNVGLNVVLCLIAVWLGVLTARQLN